MDTKVLGEFWADPKASNPVQELMDRSYRILAMDLKNWGHTGEVVLPLVEN